MSKLRKPFLFALAILPAAVIGGIFTCLYQFDLYSSEIVEEMTAQIGSREIVVLISALQSALYALVCSFLGYILAEKTGLLRPFRFEKGAVLRSLLFSVIAGILFSLDYWTFGAVLPQITDSYKDGMTVYGVLASVLYGGIVEEIMMRLFVMSLVSFIIWKLFFRGRSKEDIPAGVFVCANIIAALLFAAGHLPATVMAFGALTPVILIRCFLLNGGFGLLFGRLYRRYGIQYAVLSHIILHIVSKLIWFIFI